MPATTATPPPALEALYSTVPDAPGVEFALIEGTAPSAAKRLSANLLAHFVDTPRPGTEPAASTFGSEVGRAFRMTRVDLFEDPAGQGGSDTRSRVRVVVEMPVASNMCNLYGTLHGGCAAYIIDLVTLSATLALGIAGGFDGRGVSNTMNLRWHGAAPLGSVIEIVADGVHADKRTRMAQAQIRDKRTGKLLVSGEQVFLNAGPAARL